MDRWLWLCCCVLAAVALPPDGGEQTTPPFPDDFSQYEIDLDEITQEDLLQKIRDINVHQFPALIHGEPREIPLQPRGKRPPCGEVGCTRERPLYKLEEFPPGRPSLTNLVHLCSAERRKPAYGPWNLPQTGFSHLARQGEALNDLEAQFTHCCRLAEGERLPCCTDAWEGRLMRFCKLEYSIKTRPFHCCREASKEARLTCLASQAPFPAYDKEGASLNLADLSAPVLDSLCSQASHWSKEMPSPALAQNITDTCCKLQEDKKTLCAEEVKSQFIAAFCDSQGRRWKDPQNCCSQAEGAPRSSCFNRNYLSHISLLSSEQVALPTEAAP